MFCTQNFINLSGRTVVRPYNVWGAWYVWLLLYVCNLSFRCSRCLHEKVTFAQKNIIMENIHVGTHHGASEYDSSNVCNASHPSRKSPRVDFHDYSGGEYFITICTQGKEHYLGEIANGQMEYSLIGRFAVDALTEMGMHYPYAEMVSFVVMPNHVHAIIRIHPSEDLPTKRTALSVVIGGFKQAVTCFARKNNIRFGWQGRYHDHIIRGVEDRNRIAEYIEHNVARWDCDCFFQK